MGSPLFVLKRSFSSSKLNFFVHRPIDGNYANSIEECLTI